MISSGISMWPDISMSVECYLDATHSKIARAKGLVRNIFRPKEICIRNLKKKTFATPPPTVDPATITQVPSTPNPNRREQTAGESTPGNVQQGRRHILLSRDNPTDTN